MSKQPRYRVKFGKRYKKDLKRLEKSNYDLSPLEDIIHHLEMGETLDARHRDHELKGRMQGTRECHVSGDWLLRYAKDEEYLMLLLISTGDHRHVLHIE